MSRDDRERRAKAFQCIKEGQERRESKSGPQQTTEGWRLCKQLLAALWGSDSYKTSVIDTQSIC